MAEIITPVARGNPDIATVYSIEIKIPASLQAGLSFKLTDSSMNYWITTIINYTDTGGNSGTCNENGSAATSQGRQKVGSFKYPARLRYANGKLYVDVTHNADTWNSSTGWQNNNLSNWRTFEFYHDIYLSDFIQVNSGYTVSPSLSSVTLGTFTVGSAYTISGVTVYKQVSTTKTISLPSKEYYSLKSGINDLVKNNFSFQYTSGGTTTTLNSSYITVSDVSGSQYNKNVTITYNVPNPATTIATDFANGVLVPNTGAKLSTFYNTVAYNMANLNVAVTLTQSGNTFTVNSLPNPVWQYISSFALNVPVQAGGFSGTCTAFAQTGPFVNDYTVSYSGTITTWNQSVTSSMNQVCSISYTYQTSGNSTSATKTFTVDRYYGYVTSSTHLRMGVNFTGSSSLLYQSTAPTVEQLSSTTEIRSVTRL